MPARVPAGLEGWLNLTPLSPDFFVPGGSPALPCLLCPQTSLSPKASLLSSASFVPERLCPRTSLSPNFSVPDLLCPQRLELSNASFFPEHLCPRTSLSPSFFVLEVLCPQRLSTLGLPRLFKLAFQPVCHNSTPDLPRLSNLLFSLCAITLPRIYPAF